MFAFPGVWTRYKGPLKKNGDTVEQEVFAFMTTEPNELTASINHERMPVLLTDPADFDTWLSGSTDEAFKLARSYAADQMRIVQSGSDRKTFSPHEHSVNTTCRGLLRPSLFPADRRDLEHFSVQLDGFGEVRKFHPGLDALRVLRRPRLEFKIGLVVRKSLSCSPASGFLSCSATTMRSSASSTSMIRASRTRLTSLLQDEPERGLIQLDPILGVEVEILDREILAIGDDDLPRRAGVVEAEAARALHIELALHAVIVGAGLDEVAINRVKVAEVVADLFDEHDLPSVELDATGRLLLSDRCHRHERRPIHATQAPPSHSGPPPFVSLDLGTGGWQRIGPLGKTRAARSFHVHS